MKEGMEDRVEIQSKFIPSNYNIASWKNKKVWNKYKNISTYPLTIIEAKAGYGKTTSLVGFIHQEYSADFYWYSIEKAEVNIISFWSNICRAIGFREEEITDLLDELIIELNQGGIGVEEVVVHLINLLINKLNGNKYLIIDNFYVACEDKDIIDSLNYFIKFLPSSVHLILLTRLEVNFPSLYSWQIERRVLKIEEENFILNRQQIEEFALLQYDLQLTSERIEEILKESEGWILAVDLMLREMDKGNNPEEVMAEDSKSFSLLVEYFNCEVLDYLSDKDPYLINFLLQTSILKKLEVDICNQLLDINISQQILEQLLSSQAFLYQIDDDDGYCYHNLFKEFLEYTAKQKYDYNLLHNKAKEIYYNEGRDDGVVYHILQVGDEEEIVKLVIENISDWKEREKFNLLEKCLDFLSQDTYLSHPYLHIYQGDIYYQEEEYDLAAKEYQTAREYFQDQQNKKGLISALFKLSRLYFFLHSIKGVEYFNELINYKHLFSDKQQKEFLYLKAKACFYQGEIGQTKEMILKLKSHDIECNTLKAELAFLSGDLLQAQKLIKEIMINQERYSYFLDYIRIVINLFRGNIHQAQELVWRKIVAAKGIEKTFFEYIGATVDRMAGRRKEEISKRKYFETLKNNLDSSCWYLSMLMVDLIFWEAYYGNPELGIESGKECLTKFAKTEYGVAITYYGIGLNYHSSQNSEDSLKYFEEAKNCFEKLDNKLYLCTVLMLISAVTYELGCETKFEPTIEQTLKLARENSYDYLFLKETFIGVKSLNDFIPVLIEARDRGIEADYVNELLSEFNLSNLDRHPGYCLKIKAFGEFRLWRRCGKEEVVEEEWTRKKSKELFKLFLVNYDELIPRERICSLLWPDKEIDKAKRSFNVALNNLNQILEPNRESGAEPYFIVRHNLSYGLNRRISYSYDVADFEEAIKRGDRTKDGVVKMNYYQQAVELYQDDFLVHDLYKSWINIERERLIRLFLDTANNLIEYYFKQGEYEESIQLADRILAIDKYFEQAYLYKMKSYEQLGQRSFAVKTYQKCKGILNKELNINPISEIEDYYQKLTLENST
ncbi:BTAD domain-containing putative transcriptional regulator [Acetohalobium arabaticum]|uniref:Transcriptional activator domain protein n=1 Tax=Acetohalobium arabaticum (strain ATCC 49924 / DSM 5501 / Z-7288) TaxID=574087 RepID=D9QS61_ACEAZ|nr:BTAD domain-containing putative transcriptional regulator [Acetohalobium arabaticum]ADL13352.1 transcriptional activator domain protein [Acetohalobium arabaticum DSM 5501]